jgi:DNA invertase Pin-like site-specific DNA recombinase
LNRWFGATTPAAVVNQTYDLRQRRESSADRERGAFSPSTSNSTRSKLKASGCEVFYQEQASGKLADRPELENTLKALRTGDALVVWRLDRLGRSLADLVRIVNDLEGRSVGLVSLTEQINTTSPSGKLVFHLFASLAEFERTLIRERTMAGLKAARARGRNGGRPAKLAGKDLAMAKALMADRNNDVGEIAKRFGVHRSTLYRLLKP